MKKTILFLLAAGISGAIAYRKRRFKLIHTIRSNHGKSEGDEFAQQAQAVTAQ